MAQNKGAKKFYSCLDTGVVDEVPQSAQHVLAAKMAEIAGGTVVFYTMEDVYTLKTQEVIQSKLNEKPDVNGIIFYRVHQFFYAPEFSFNLMARIIKLGLEIHFARERISIRTLDELEADFSLLYAAQQIKARPMNYFDSLVDSYKA